MLIDRGTRLAWNRSSEDKRYALSAARQTLDSADDVVPEKGVVVLIDNRTLVRECLAQSIRSATGQEVLAFSSVETWLKAPDTDLVSLIVICAGSSPREVDVCREALVRLSQSSRRIIPSILLSDSENPDWIVNALEQGASGYIPTSVALDVAIEAMRLVRAGGTFVPASSLTARRSDDGSTTNQIGDVKLTARQAQVVEALRRGKANKIIAYELGMCESTVKVHVRNVMKKFKATNRTQLAFIAGEMLGSVEE